MPLNSGGSKSSRTLGRSAQRLTATTQFGSKSTGAIRRVGQRLTNVIFKHPTDGHPTDFISPTSTVPEIISLAPTSGTNAGGTAVAIRGDKFTGSTGATIGGVAVTSFVVVDDEHITCVTGAHANGAVTLIVLNPRGNATKLTAFTYV